MNVREVYIYEPIRTGTPDLAEAPEDMVGWFQQHPYLKTSKPEPSTVGGQKTTSVCGSDCVDLFKSSSGLKLGLGEGAKEREIILEDVKGGTGVIRFGSPATEFDEFAREAQKVISSVL